MLVTSTLRGPIAYHVVGDAPGTPIVLINGGPGYDHQYLHLSPAWERLGAHRRVVFFDQPGTGHSYDVGSGDTVSVQDLLDAISAIQSALGADSLALLGHSWGGYVAMAFAVRHPERTEGIILVGTAAPNWTDTEFNFGPLFPDSLARGASEPSDPDGARKDLRRHLAMSFYSPATRQIVLNGFAGLPRNARQAELLVADASANDLWTPIGTLRMPVLVGTGRFDANVAPRTSWRVHEAIPMSKFVVWERSGHYPMIEEPDAFVEVILRFLSDPSRP
jgi:proline iminopeptidase